MLIEVRTDPISQQIDISGLRRINFTDCHLVQTRGAVVEVV